MVQRLHELVLLGQLAEELLEKQVLVVLAGEALFVLVEAEEEIALLMQMKRNLLSRVFHYLLLQRHFLRNVQGESAAVGFPLGLTGIQRQDPIVDLNDTSILNLRSCIKILLLDIFLDVAEFDIEAVFYEFSSFLVQRLILIKLPAKRQVAILDTLVDVFVQFL